MLVPPRRGCERFSEEVRADEPELAAKLRIEERELSRTGGTSRVDEPEHPPATQAQI